MLTYDSYNRGDQGEYDSIYFYADTVELQRKIARDDEPILIEGHFPIAGKGRYHWHSPYVYDLAAAALLRA